MQHKHVEVGMYFRRLNLIGRGTNEWFKVAEVSCHPVNGDPQAIAYDEKRGTREVIRWNELRGNFQVGGFLVEPFTEFE